MPEQERRLNSPSASLFASSARRLWNQIVVRLHGLQIEFAYSTDYQVDLGTTPVDSLRAQKILTYLLSQAMIAPQAIVTAADVYALGVIRSEPPIDGRSASGIVTVPSAFW